MVKAESHVIVHIYHEAKSGHSPLLGGLQILFIAHLYEAAGRVASTSDVSHKQIRVKMTTH